MVLTLSRQTILPVLLIAVFARMGSLPLLWSAFVVAEAIPPPVGFLFWTAEAGKTLKAFPASGQEADYARKERTSCEPFVHFLSARCMDAEK